MLIYKIVNKINNKVYIGQTIQTLKRRWWSHCKDSKTFDYPLYRAIRKYGLVNFSVEQIDTAIDKWDLNNLEDYYIKLYNSLSPNGYNLLSGGNNIVFHESTKKKLSNAIKGENHWLFGKKHSEESKEKMRGSRPNSSLTMRGKPKSEEHRKNLSLANIGKKLSKEECAKISQRMQGQNHPMWKKTPSQKTKDLMSIAHKKNPLKHTSKKIVCLTTGIIYESGRQAAKDLNLLSGQISNVCKGKRTHTGGYKFKFLDSESPIYKSKRKLRNIICNETLEVFTSTKSILAKFGGSNANLCRHLKGEYKTFGGFTFKELF